MFAKEAAFFVIAFALAGGVVNALGIFDEAAIYEVDDIDASLTDDIMEIDESAAAEGDLSTAVDGWKMVAQSFAILKTVLTVLLLPGPYLVSIFGNGAAVIAFAAAVQVLCNLILVWGIMQFALNRSTADKD